MWIYTWLRDNGSDEGLMDWLLIDKRLEGSLKDVNVLMSWYCVIGNDHFLLVAKLCWRRTRYEIKEEQKVKVIRVSELLKKEKEERYKELIDKDWSAVRSRAVRCVEEEWKSFKGTLLRISEERRCVEQELKLEQEGGKLNGGIQRQLW
jgi:hypothetical protein